MRRLTPRAAIRLQVIEEIIALSRVYLEDGAPRTAAARLRKAADMIDQLADQNEAALASLVAGDAA